MAVESKNNIDYLSLARTLEKAVREAGQAILDIYQQVSDVQIKSDGSPVTEADLASEKILLPAISVAAPFIQIVSEENVTSYRFEVTDRFFWLTRSMVRRNFSRLIIKVSSLLTLALSRAECL